MRAPTLRQIEALKALAEAGTVSLAADALRISQPAVSKLLRSLEFDTELKLFQRDGRRLALTPQGRRIYEEIDRVFAGIHQISRAIDAIRQEERGRLNIGVMPSLSGPLISAAVKNFLERYPDVYVAVFERSSQFLYDWLLHQQLDVAILYVNPPHANTIHCEPLASQPFACAVPLDHRLASEAFAPLEELNGERFIAYASTAHVRAVIQDLLDQYGITMNVVLEATTASNVCELVAAGLGIAIVHPLGVPVSLRNKISIVPLRPSAQFAFQLCRARDCRNIAFVNAFAEEVKKAAAASLADMSA